MAHQAAVTDYFSRKRVRSQIQPSKRKRVGSTSNDVEAEIACKEVIVVVPEKNKPPASHNNKQIYRATRSSTRTTRSSAKNASLSAVNDKVVQQETTTSDDDTSCKKSMVGVVTAANDNHSIPTSPKRPKDRNNKNDEIRQKRGRLSPKQKAFDFESSTNLEPKTTFSNAEPKLTRNARKRLQLNTANTRSDSQESKQDLANNNVEEDLGTTKRSQKNTSRKKALKQKSNEQEKLTNAVQLAEKLLSKKKESKQVLQDSIKKQGNLKDLQETLLKLKDLKKKGKPKAASSSKEDTQVVKKKEYAYTRLHNLAQDIPKGLSLPFKYKILKEMFRSADTVVSMLFNRQETATWMKVQQSVKDMISKNFEQKDLGRIKQVFPDAYKYRQEKGIPTFSDHVKTSDYQLTLEPILDDEECEKLSDQPKKLTSSMLVKRRHHFHLELINIVKQHHKMFLSSIEPGIEVKDDKLRRWHPQFLVDQVPDIEPDQLPPPPDRDAKRCQSAKDVLDKAKDRLTKKAVEALKKVADRCGNLPEKTPTDESPTIEENNNITPVKKTSKQALKGVSNSLLAKIREKEAEGKLRKMLRSDENEKTLDMLKILPDVANSLRILFLAEKKNALPFEYAATKLCGMCPSCTPGTSEELLRLLSKHTAPWASVTLVRKQEYLKLDRNAPIQNVLATLKRKYKEVETSC